MNLTWLLNGDHPTTLRARAKAARNRLIIQQSGTFRYKNSSYNGQKVIGRGGGVGVGSSRCRPLIGFGKKRQDGTVSSRDGVNVSSCLRKTRDQTGTEQHRPLPGVLRGRG